MPNFRHSTSSHNGAGRSDMARLFLSPRQALAAIRPELPGSRPALARLMAEWAPGACSSCSRGCPFSCQLLLFALSQPRSNRSSWLSSSSKTSSTSSWPAAVKPPTSRRSRTPSGRSEPRRLSFNKSIYCHSICILVEGTFYSRWEEPKSQKPFENLNLLSKKDGGTYASGSGAKPNWIFYKKHKSSNWGKVQKKQVS